MEISSQLHSFGKTQFGAHLKQPEKNGVKGSSDEIKMSNEALLLTEALRGAQNAPDVREDKVAELKAAIESGTYNINGRLIAEKIITEETSLFI